MSIDLDDVVDGYIECALWSSVHYASEDDSGTPMDDIADESDLAEEALEAMRADCEAFIEATTDLDGLDAGQIGHDFWLTRNHHGAGFWDRGLGDRGDRLTKLAHSFGSCDLYIGDDGRVYAA